MHFAQERSEGYFRRPTRWGFRVIRSSISSGEPRGTFISSLLGGRRRSCRSTSSCGVLGEREEEGELGGGGRLLIFGFGDVLVIECNELGSGSQGLDLRGELVCEENNSGERANESGRDATLAQLARRLRAVLSSRPPCFDLLLSPGYRPEPTRTCPSSPGFGGCCALTSGRVRSAPTRIDHRHPRRRPLLLSLRQVFPRGSRDRLRLRTLIALVRTIRANSELTSGSSARARPRKKKVQERTAWSLLLLLQPARRWRARRRGSRLVWDEWGTPTRRRSSC